MVGPKNDGDCYRAYRQFPVHTPERGRSAKVTRPVPFPSKQVGRIGPARGRGNSEDPRGGRHGADDAVRGATRGNGTDPLWHPGLVPPGDMSRGRSVEMNVCEGESPGAPTKTDGDQRRRKARNDINARISRQGKRDRPRRPRRKHDSHETTTRSTPALGPSSQKPPHPGAGTPRGPRAQGRTG